MTKQNPFSLYDFFGYLIPGATLIYTYLIFEYIGNNPDFEIKSLISEFSTLNYEGILIFIILSYSLGHLLSFLSSITIEKYGNWKYGYPSKYLLGLVNGSYFLPTKEKENESISDNKIRLKNKIENRWRLFVLILLFPFIILDNTIGKIFGFRKFYQNPLDTFLSKSIMFKVSLLMDSLGLTNKKVISDFNPEENDFHRIVSHYAFENCKQHQFRMVNYVALYGFLRDLSLIFNALSWIYIFKMIKSINFNHQFDFFNLKITLVLMIISFISFMAFMKFYRRYTLEGFMLIVVDKDLKSTPNNS